MLYCWKHPYRLPVIADLYCSLGPLPVPVINDQSMSNGAVAHGGAWNLVLLK